MSDDSHEVCCSHCGGRGFLKGIFIGVSGDYMSFGLRFNDGWLRGDTEPMVADLCRTCGTIQRLYVKDIKHNWQPKQPGSDLRGTNPR